jgi:hypothetical protein
MATCGGSPIVLIFADLLGRQAYPRIGEGKGIKTTSDNSTERRKATRYRMSAQVIFRWGKSHKDRFQSEGTTRDVSLAGACVLTETCPPVNETVQMEIILPPLFTPSGTRMKAEMKVLRVDEDTASKRRIGLSIVGKGFSVQAISKQPSDPITGFVDGNEGKK